MTVTIPLWTNGPLFDFSGYQTDAFYDEMFHEDGTVREVARPLVDFFKSLGSGEIAQQRTAAEAALLNMGITFTVYKEESGIERIFPFDLIPRVIAAKEWEMMERGLRQRLRALNLFLQDIYNEKKIVKDGVVPAELIANAEGYRAVCEGFTPPKGVWVSISGIDIVRHSDGEYYVLEDNLRTPSGVSYVLENRNVIRKLFPKLFAQMKVRPVINYPTRLRETLAYLAPEGVTDPNIVVLTPGIYNSAYFEHSFLAREMGVQLVEGRDLVVHEGVVKMRTTKGFERVDVIYRRVDDDFLDPKVFRKDSMLGVPGIWEVYRNGRVGLANALGNGIADDKVIYAFVPKMIKYYLDEDPILNNVPTFVCYDKKEREHVLANLDKLVVKAANQSGGYGMLVGPHAAPEEREKFRELILANPRDYIAQPTLGLSRVPTLVDDTIEGRHVDLRPYILCSDDIYVLPGGLTRVALKKGSLVVNSSQGGGSKDTWVLPAEGGTA